VSFARGPSEVSSLVPSTPDTPTRVARSGNNIVIAKENLQSEWLILLQPPLFTQTIPSHFSSIVTSYGDRPAVVALPPLPLSSFSSSSLPIPRTLTYSDLDALSNTLASSLRSGLGVRKGDRLAVSLGNTAEFAALTYAAFKLGAVLVPLNPAFNAQQVEAALSHLGVAVLIIGAVTDLAYKPGRGRSNLSLLQEMIPDLERKGGGRVEAPRVPSLEKVVVVDNRQYHPEVDFALEKLHALTPYSTLLEGSPRPLKPDEPLSPDETINIQFTSGTTSHPKAAMLSHTSILNNGALIAQRMGLDPTDRIVVPPPLFHCFGSVLGYMATATTGAAILFSSPAFDPVSSLKMARHQNATGLYGVTTMLVSMLDALRSGAAPRPEFLQKGIVAGSSVPEALMRRVFRELGLRDLVICYGMTETSPVSVMTAPSDPFVKRTATVGKPMPHTGIKIVDPADRSRVLPVGQRGELAASGYLVMKGYYGDEARTAEARIRDQEGEVWMYSGDEAVMDEDGYVAITGRIKDLIIRGGENIHPLEVENCLFQCPGVGEVSVVGVPEERYGEVVGAFIVRQKDEEGAGLTDEGIREWVRTRLSSHLVPKHVWWVDEYPKTASGKIQKYKLRDMARELVGAERAGTS